MVFFIRNKQIWDKNKFSQSGIRSFMRKKFHNILPSGKNANVSFNIGSKIFILMTQSKWYLQQQETSEATEAFPFLIANCQTHCHTLKLQFISIHNFGNGNEDYERPESETKHLKTHSSGESHICTHSSWPGPYCKIQKGRLRKTLH